MDIDLPLAHLRAHAARETQYLIFKAESSKAAHAMRSTTAADHINILYKISNIFKIAIESKAQSHPLR